MKLGDADKLLQDLERHYDIKKTVKESMEFPAQDQTQLFHKFATPESFEADESVTRENATSNLSEKDFAIITAVGSIRSNFIHFRNSFFDYNDLVEKLKVETDADKKAILQADIDDSKKAVMWIDNFIHMVGDDIIIRATTSKGKKGWLGNLIISSKRFAEISTGAIKEGGKKLFGLGR